MDSSFADLDDLLARLGELVDAREGEAQADPGEGNFNCEDCNACYNCRFCVGCDGCEDCTYCEGCVDCLGCTQSKRSLSCEGCAYIEDCRECEASRYLVLCLECVGCVHCLGCVGLKDAEYCVLNEKVGKKRFYEALNWVRAEIERRAEQGWRPELIGIAGDLDEGEGAASLEPADSEGEGEGEGEGEDEGWNNPWQQDKARPEVVQRSDASPNEAAPWRASTEDTRDDEADSPWRAAAKGTSEDADRKERTGSASVTGAGSSITRGSAPTRRAPPGVSSPPLPSRMPWEDSQVVELPEPSRPRAPTLDATPTPATYAPATHEDEAVPEPDDKGGGLRRGHRPPRRR